MRRAAGALAIAATAVLAIAATAALGGCADELGDLDRERLLAIARTPGNAVGNDYAGTWSVEIELEHCTCPEGLVIPVACLPSQDPTPYFGVVSFVQAGGMLATGSGLQASGGARLSLSYSGGVDDDGHFTVAGVRHESTVGLTIDTWSRIDGVFEADGDAPFVPRRFDATASLRSLAQPALRLEGQPRRVDCRGDYVLTGTR